MLKLAIKARLPLVAVTTSDRLHFVEVIQHLTDKSPVLYGGLMEMDKNGMPTGKIKPGKELTGHTIYYGHHRGKSDLPNSLYLQMQKMESTYIGINFKTTPSNCFDAGDMPVPKPLVAALVSKAVGDKALVKAILPALGGLTLKDVGEALRLTMARDGSATPAGLMSTRRAMIHSTQGLTQIDTYDPAYIPDPWLQSWLARERPFFLTGEDHRLIPRGLLLKGEPGTGKTACAKYIAAQLGVPCYRIDLGETKNKWVGQSEANLKAALQRLDQEAPCVALLDEIEKMTGGHESDSTGVTSSMMSQLLWWQAERRARVLPVMTTNDITKLPPELYRPGRIDKVVEFSGLKTPASIIKFAQHVLKQFPVELHVPPKILTEGLAHLVAPQTQATITEAVKEIIKTHAKH